MVEIVGSRTDRQVGSALSGEDVERLRAAIAHVRKRYGFRLREIAVGCGASEHTVRNFAYRKSIRPDNAFLGRLYKYFESNRALMPGAELSPSAEARSESAAGAFSRDALMKFVKTELPVGEDDLRRVFERYRGYYLFVRRSLKPAEISVSWLHVLPLYERLDGTRTGLPLPRFTMFIRYPDRFDPIVVHSRIVLGYAYSRGGRLFFVGHYDGELEFMSLLEPPTTKFTYVHGLCLLNTLADRQPIATRVVCQYLGPKASRGQWEEKIGLFEDEAFDRLFDNAAALRRALGSGDVLTVDEPI